MAQGFLAIVGNTIKQVFAIVSSAGASDAGKIPALGENGRLSESFLPPGIGASTQSLEATESLSAGDFVNFFNAAGEVKMRLADNSNGRPAHGFVRESVASSATGTAYPLGEANDGVSGLTPGSYYFLNTAGGITTTAPDSTVDFGILWQRLGIAISATELQTFREQAIEL